MYGGGPLNKERGNFLASQGVNIYVTYAWWARRRNYRYLMCMLIYGGQHGRWSTEHFPSQSVLSVVLLPRLTWRWRVIAGNPGMDWEYFSFSGHTRPELLPYSGDIFEVAMTVGKFSLWNRLLLSQFLSSLDAAVETCFAHTAHTQWHNRRRGCLHDKWPSRATSHWAQFVESLWPCRWPDYVVNWWEGEHGRMITLNCLNPCR